MINISMGGPVRRSRAIRGFTAVSIWRPMVVASSTVTLLIQVQVPAVHPRAAVRQARRRAAVHPEVLPARLRRGIRTLLIIREMLFLITAINGGGITNGQVTVSPV